MSRCLVTGATGVLGTELLRELDAPRVLARDPSSFAKRSPHVQGFAWSADRPVPPEAMQGVDTIVHLAGDPVASGRWTVEKKKAILESRVQGTRNIVRAIESARDKPRLLVSASAVGYYGSRGDDVLAENAAPGSDFLAEVCQAWENEALAARDLGVRVVCLRIGIVLAKKGGALDAMLPLFRKGLGGPLGSGQQWMPWVHARDVVRVILFAANESSISGPINVCAPNPVRNEDFTQALGRALHRPAFLRAPEFGIRLMLGEFADAVLSSQRAVPNALLAAGYTFSFEELARALKDATAPSEEAAPTGGT